MQETILIIGGTGFIGKHLCMADKLKKFKITVLSKNILNNKDKINGIEYLNQDIENFEKLNLVISSRTFNYIVNLSGYINHSLFSISGSLVIDTHFNGLLNLIKCLNFGKLKHFIQIGSSDEYGNNKAPQVETMRELPISPYAFAKTSSSHFLQMLYKTEKFPVTILRLFLTYGPGQGIDRFLPFIINQCILGNSFPVSKGEQIRDFCFVSDIVDGIIKTLLNKNSFGEIINLASGNPIKIKSIISLVQDQIGKGKPNFGKIAYRKEENMALFADVAKAHNILKWKPKTVLEDGLRKTIISYKKDFYNEV
jgi:nucleoside-diphosphate-sugar epimerase